MLLFMGVSKTIKSRLKPQGEARSVALDHQSLPTTKQEAKKREALNKLLTQSLAAYVVLNSRKPMCDVIDELFDLEFKAAQMVTTYLNDGKNRNLRGALAGVYSVIPMGNPPKMVKQMMLEKTSKPHRPKKKKSSKK